MPHVLAEVKASHAQNQRILAGFEQSDEYLQNFVVLLVQFVRVFAPKSLAAMNRTPLKPTAMDLSHVLVIRAENAIAFFVCNVLFT